MQYKILASDYDNTLVPFGESQPRPAMVKAVKKLQAAGGKFVLSTGRAWSAINRKGQLGGIRFDYAITCNGACVVDKNGAIVAEHPMTSEEITKLLNVRDVGWLDPDSPPARRPSRPRPCASGVRTA